MAGAAAARMVASIAMAALETQPSLSRRLIRAGIASKPIPPKACTASTAETAPRERANSVSGPMAGTATFPIFAREATAAWQSRTSSKALVSAEMAGPPILTSVSMIFCPSPGASSARCATRLSTGGGSNLTTRGSACAALSRIFQSDRVNASSSVLAPGSTCRIAIRAIRRTPASVSAKLSISFGAAPIPERPICPTAMMASLRTLGSGCWKRETISGTAMVAPRPSALKASAACLRRLGSGSPSW